MSHQTSGIEGTFSTLLNPQQTGIPADRPNELVELIEPMSHAQPVLPQNSRHLPGDEITVLQLTPTTPRKKRRSARRHVIIVAAIAGLSLCILSTASPAGIPLVDALYRSAFGLVVVLAAARSSRWSLAVLSGVASITAANLALQILSGAGLGLLIWISAKKEHRPVGAAVVGALSIVTLSMQGHGPLWRLTAGDIADPIGTSAALIALAVAPVIFTSWKTLARKQRKVLRTWAKRCALGVASILVVTAGAFALSVTPLRSAIDDSQAAIDVASDGDLAGATELLVAANESWDGANSRVSGPWMIPSRLVPIVGQHVRAAQILTGQASAVTEAAAAVTGTVDPDDFIIDGAINVNAIDANLPAIDAFARTLDRAAVLSHDADSPVLLPPFRQRTTLASDVLDPASGVVGATAQALHVANELLGSSEPSQILVMVTTPAEARGSGGFVGNWALISAADGRVEIADQYRTKDLNDLLEANEATLGGDIEYVDRYARFDIEQHIQDVTISPDFPSVARVTADLFAQATETQVEAVVMVDPFVIEQLLAFAGPAEIETGLLRSSDVLDYLFVEQYEQFEVDDAEREDELAVVTQEVFQRLLENPPEPVALVNEFAPLADQDRLALWLRDDTDGSVVERLGVSGAFPNHDGDLLGVVHQNAGQNKVDSFLQRTVAISSVLDRATNTVQHDIEITLENSAPTSGLPDAIIGSNDQNLVAGANSMLLSMYSATPITMVTIDETLVPFETATEFGVNVATMLITVPPQDSVTLELRAQGDIDLSNGYDTVLANQPLVNADQVSWTIQTTTGERLLTGSQDWELATSSIDWMALLTKDRNFSFDFDS